MSSEINTLNSSPQSGATLRPVDAGLPKRVEAAMDDISATFHEAIKFLSVAQADRTPENEVKHCGKHTHIAGCSAAAQQILGDLFQQAPARGHSRG